MILLADGGSTKTEWRVIEDGAAGESLYTSGINPFFLSGEDIFILLEKELNILSGKSFSKVIYYGTGCSSAIKENIVKRAIEKFFSPDEIFIGSDLLGAARALCQDEPGIACIMGTGSNSCYFDGTRIAANVSPLGYILGDEGGAAVLGRKLVSGVLKKQVPKDVIERFFETYKMSPADILENVYMKPFPNRFLGQFARFLSSNSAVPELRFIITSSFDEFIIRNILQYPEAEDLPVHFTGSIAWHFRPFLEESLKAKNLNPGTITQSPMENLVIYHTNNNF
jgi:N-acetylglucosamine kinase-like BadF-type ATPase